MNLIEKDMVKGMVSILNEAKDIISEERYNAMFNDLKELEEETEYVLFNSPTHNDVFKNIIIKEDDVFKPKFKELNSVDDIVKNFNKNGMVVYVSLDGVNVHIRYVNGVISEIKTTNTECLKQVNNIPYKINKKGVFDVYGKITSVDDKLKFFVDKVVDTTDDNKDGLKKAKELEFDVVPNWFAASLNPKKMQGTIDYIFDYVEEEGFSCNGIMFRTEDILNQVIFKLNKENN